MVDAPLRELDEADLLAALAQHDERLLTLNEYAVASQHHHERTGHYLDERATWSRLGSRIDGQLVAARFDGAAMAEGLGDEAPADGALLVAYDLSPGDRAKVLGARTSTRTVASARATDRLVETARRPSRSTPFPLDPQDHGARETLQRHACDAYVALGFAAELGMSEADYRASLPSIAPPPPALRGRLDVPVLVETRIPWRRQAELARIRFSYGVRTSEAVDIDEGARPPHRHPYVTWCNDWGRRFPLAIAPQDARSRLGADEIGGNIEELVAIEILYPAFSAAGHYFEAIGTRMAGLVDSVATGSGLGDRYPVLYRWRRQAELGANLTPRAYSIIRPLVRAAEPS
ncbi:hypothetical protein QI633_17670 [Nocardioides sp. QY071]|uniref:hypothetical protein n=1 Tax=Nocardioides sp. QY071 TaxID=3044187 RepID=UPI00249CE58D|nr:hypothetical protein [Nocardioides sp. QY071]WGY00362.1 hypothetical protein QI633_17670 [Nocardioides sp. QY071]